MGQAISAGVFKAEVRRLADLTDSYLSARGPDGGAAPAELSRAVSSYILHGGKRLRPAVLLFSCGAVGGDLLRAIPAAAAVEVFHTWTLVHDDVIDNDCRRRGNKTVHVEAAEWAASAFGVSAERAAEYGRDVAILAGDVQQGWAVSLMLDCVARGVSPEVVLGLVSGMSGELTNRLIEGEMLDVAFSMRPFGALSESEILRMLRLKTGILLRYAAQAGAAIGLDVRPDESPRVRLLGDFAERCGIAFQLQDDILGVTGSADVLGKPVGSDIREGKRTIVALEALKRVPGRERAFLGRVIGDREATAADVARVQQLMVDCGAVQYAADLAVNTIGDAVDGLRNALPASEARSYLLAWADFMVSRTY